jgi:hypothetical protein|tara:strand:+ start:287 stop:508 length:222 start_codon:yes stop_codon:yes gene_type:complete
MKDIKQLVGIEATQVADLIQNHQDILQEDDGIVENIANARMSLQFFMSLEEDNRAYYEAKNIKHKIMQHLGLV